jgi:NADH:ubiquinone oxidoreductase subunit 3 (subunit A)
MEPTIQNGQSFAKSLDTPQQIVTNTNNPLAQQPKPIKKYKKATILVAIFLVIIILLMALFIFVKNAQSPINKNPVQNNVISKPKSNTIKNWNTYKDKINDFSIQYPSSWYDIAPESGVVGFSTHNGPYKGTIIVATIDNEVTNNDLQEITKPVPGEKMDNQVTQELINDIPVIKLLTRSQTNGNVHFNENYYYVLITFVSKKTLKFTTNVKDKPVLDQMISTFAITK